MRVLVVDDEFDTRDLLTTLLTSCGATVSSGKSSAERLNLLTRERFDVIISDIEMPGEDGYTFIRKVRSMEAENRPTPAIALTAHARPEDRMRALAAGYQSHVAKPVEPVELTVVIGSLTRQFDRPSNEA